MNFLLSFLKPIFSALFETIVSSFKEWYEAESREAAEWAAKSREAQIESLKDGRQLEAGMRVARDTAKIVSSVEDWNKQAKDRNRRNQTLGIMAVFACMFLFSGCFRFYVNAREYKPYIQLPEQPQLSANAPIKDPDFQAVLTYVSELQAVVDFYNEQAYQNNLQNGFQVEENNFESP